MDKVLPLMPSEMIFEILVHLRNDLFALKACALVNSTWSEISRAYLFHSLDLNLALSKNNYDCITLLINMPAGLGEYVKRLCIKNVDWSAARSSGMTWNIRALRHLTPKSTVLDISDSSFPDFLDLVKIVCSVRHLRSLKLRNVSWAVNTFKPADVEEMNLFAPPYLSSLHMYHTDTTPIMTWFFGHPPELVPKATTLYFGPLYAQWNSPLMRYLCEYSSTLSEFGILFASQDQEYPYFHLSPSGSIHRCSSPARGKTKNGVDGCPCMKTSSSLRVLRFHDFLAPAANPSLCVGASPKRIGIPRVTASLMEKFDGTVIFDVRVKAMSEVDCSAVNWAALEAVFAHEIYEDMKGIIFKVWTDINLVTLENFISRKMPRVYARNILKFEREVDFPY